MKNKRNLSKMLVVVLLFGTIVAGFNGCSKNVDLRLNGTWKSEDDVIVEYNAGKFAIVDSVNSDIPINQGYYTTSDGKITLTYTHVNGYFLGLDSSRLYTKDEYELEGKSTDLSPLFNSRTFEYVVDDNKITYSYDDGKTSNTFSDTLVSRDIKFTQANSSSKESEPKKKSSGSKSALVGRWELDDYDYNDNYYHSYDDKPSSELKTMELLKDGTGIVGSLGVTWKVENERFYIISPVLGLSANYNVSGSTLTLTNDKYIFKYKKK